MKPCRCPCGLAVELRAVAAPGCFHSVCSDCTAACNAAVTHQLRQALDDCRKAGRSASLVSAARMLAEANTAPALSPVRRERAKT